MEKLKIKINRRNFFLTGIVILLTFAVGAAIKTQAGTGQSGAGWPWGGSEEQSDGNPNNGLSGYETGAGWISMNSANCDTNGSGIIDAGDSAPLGCPPIGTAIPNYGVDIPVGDGNLSGYAWSENIGWISFNPDDLTGCPFGTCTARRVTTPTDHLEGWARIVGIKTEFQAVPSNSGGWEGWISLDDQSGSNYGVTINGSNLLQGYGWSASSSGAAELGWIDFSKAKIVASYDLKICNSCDTASTPLTSKTMDLSAGSKYVKACWIPSTSTNCGSSSDDVTNSANWYVDTSNEAITKPMTNPGKIDPLAIGTDTVRATYNSDIPEPTVDVTVQTSCSYNLCDTSTNYLCEQKTVINGTCPANNCTTLGESCAPPSGTNWKEVAP